MAPPQLPNTCVHTRSHLSPNLLALPPHVFSSSGSDPHDGCQARLPHNPFVLVMWPSSVGRAVPLMQNWMATLQATMKGISIWEKQEIRGSVFCLQGWTPPSPPTNTWSPRSARFTICYLCFWAQNFWGNNLSHKCIVTNHSETAGKLYHDNGNWLMPPKERAQLKLVACEVWYYCVVSTTSDRENEKKVYFASLRVF